jgi:hypothetical protein
MINKIEEPVAGQSIGGVLTFDLLNQLIENCGYPMKPE